MAKNKRNPSKKNSAGLAGAPISTKEYANLLEQLKKDIQQTQLRAALAITKELTMLYWRMGKMLSDRITNEKWGTKIIEHLAKDLQESFPDVSGFSVRNLKYMRKLADCYQDINCAAAAAQIPWGHNMIILDRVKDPNQRLWYVGQTIENGWSRSMLEHWIESNIYKRQGKAVTNFKQTLPSPQSDLAEQVLKDPYNFSFLALDKKYRESDLEQGLIDHIQKFLLELGDGFAFIGRQYHLEVDEKDYYIDLLFYHAKLHCYVVIEIKSREFDPRDAGQISFYLSAVDDNLKSPDDKPTIGLLLCKSKRKLTVEYTLRKNLNPIGVASYETKLVKSLPKELKSCLPTIQQIEAELEKHEVLAEIKRTTIKPKRTKAKNKNQRN